MLEVYVYIYSIRGMIIKESREKIQGKIRKIRRLDSYEDDSHRQCVEELLDIPIVPE